MLERDRVLRSIAREQHGRRRKAAAGALARDGDASTIDAELGRLRVQPRERRVTVFDRARMRRLRRKPIVDRDHRRAELRGVGSIGRHSHVRRYP